ncbi:MAG TPA: thioredoxin domain-containing protein [Thermomicrobiales bacterium]|nr:thioredoxin domain-containing protein [Thermomicrobiales bacterium]
MTALQSATLTPPASNDDYAQGPATAPATLVEYGDFQCPSCGRAYPIVKEIQRQFGDQLRFVWRNFPLTQIHPQAESAAEAAEAAGAQGAFWGMHDLLFEHQVALGAELYLACATTLGLDVDRFARELADGVYADKVRQDFLSGVRSGVNGTPTFFINGRRHDGAWDADALAAAIERAARER